MAERAYPLIFAFQDLVYGEGFLAGVVARGRALMVHEGDGWWLYGVQPGGMAEHGETPHEAYLLFRQAFTSVLFDMAADAKTYDDFQVEARGFFEEKDEEEEAGWFDRLEALQSGRLIPEAPFDSLPRESAHEPPLFRLERLDGVQSEGLTPSGNLLDHYALPVAA